MAEGSGQRLGFLYWDISARLDRAQFEQEARRAGQLAGIALDKGFDANGAGHKGAQQFVESLTRDLTARREDIKKEAISGLITAREAAAAGRAASQSYIENLRGGLNALREKGVITTASFPSLLSQGAGALRTQTEEMSRLASQVASVERATSGAGNGLIRMRGPLTQLATSALGASSNVGSLASSVGLFVGGAELTLGITAGIAAMVFAYNKLTEGARKAKEQIDQVIDSLQKQVEAQFRASRAGKQAAASAALLSEDQAASHLDFVRGGRSELDFEGRPTGKIIVDLKAVKAAEDALADARKRREFADAAATQSEEERASALGRAIRAGAKNNAITAEAIALTKQYRTELAGLFASGRNDEDSLSRIGKLQSMIDDLSPSSPKAKTKQTRAPRDTTARDAAKDAKEASDLAKQIRDIAAQSTVTAVDDLNNALADLQKTMRAEGATDEQIAQVTALKQSMIDATAAAEKLAPILDQIKGDTAEGFNLTGNLSALDKDGGLIDQAIAARNAAKPGSTAQAVAQADLDKLLAEELELRKKIKAIQDGTTEKTKGLAADTAKLSGEIANAANAAFGLASAFLGVDSNITKALGSLGQLSGGISSVSGLASKAGGFGALFSSGAGIASALPGIGQAIGGGIALASSLFGKSPEEKERLQRLKENNAQLAHLSNRIGDLGKNITGADAKRVSDAISNPNLKSLISTDALSRVLGKNLTDLGLSFKDLAAIAKELGITVDEKRIQFADIEKIRQALKDVELGKFADTFAGQMAKLAAEINVLDIKDPIKQFAEFKKAIDGVHDGGGILSETLKSFDLSNPEGVAAAIKSLQDLFGQVTSGQIDPTQFGGLTGQDLVDAIQRALDLLRTGSSSSAGTGGFNVSQQITEVTGSRIGAMLSTANSYHQIIAENTAGILRQLGGSVNPGPIGPPPSSAGQTSGLSGGVSINMTLNVNVSGAVSDAQATAVGQKISEATIRAIDSGLGNRAKWARRSVGDVSRN